MKDVLFAAIIIIAVAVASTMLYSDAVLCRADSPHGPRLGGAMWMWGCP